MTLEKTYLIYKYTSPSGKAYIGQTCDLKSRRRGHQKTRRSCCAFQDAIDKYGWDNFIEEILEDNLTVEEANIFEELYIAEHNTLSPNGYNLTTGGLNYTVSDVTKEKIRQSRLGTKASVEAIENNRLAHPSGEDALNYKKVWDEEWKIKQKEGVKKSYENGRKPPNYGKKQSEEQCKTNGIIHSKTYILTFPDGYDELVFNMTKFCKDSNLGYPSPFFQIAKGNKLQHKGFKCRYYIEPFIEPPIE